MSLKGKIEAIIYAAEEPVTLDQIAALLREPVLAELAAQSSQGTEVAADAATDAGSAPAESAATENSLPVESAAENVAAETQAETQEPPAESAPAETAATEAVEVPVVEEAPAPAETQSPAADDASAAVRAPETTSKKKVKDPALAAVKARLRELLAELMKEYESDDRGIEVRQIAGGYRMATKPEHHDVVVGFAKSLKPPIRLSLPALETLAVIAYKQPVTLPEVSEIRGVDSSGVVATLLDRKLVTTAGRKQVIGRPMLYKTTKEFLLRFGLKDVSELPSMEEFEKLGEAELFDPAATETQLSLESAEAKAEATSASEDEKAESPATDEAPQAPPGVASGAVENQ